MLKAGVFCLGRFFVLFIKKKSYTYKYKDFYKFHFSFQNIAFAHSNTSASHRLPVITGHQSKFYIKIGRVVKAYQIHEITLILQSLKASEGSVSLNILTFFSLQSFKAFLGISKKRKKRDFKPLLPFFSLQSRPESKHRLLMTSSMFPMYQGKPLPSLAPLEKTTE